MTFDLKKARACAAFVEPKEAFLEALAEIERLRPFEIAARDLDSDLGKIAGERDEQAARIKELEDALVERSAVAAFLQEAWGSTIQLRAAKAQMKEWERLPEDFKESWRKGVRKQLQAEDKIGPDARPPCWQITEERKAALAAMSNLSETISCPDCGVWIGFADIGPHMAVLRAMLREAE